MSNKILATLLVWRFVCRWECVRPQNRDNSYYGYDQSITTETDSSGVTVWSARPGRHKRT
jgi:hypothetical protein